MPLLSTVSFAKITPAEFALLPLYPVRTETKIGGTF